MASIFLINDNKIVSRLLQLSSDKHGYLLEEKTDIEPSRDYYDIVLVDSDSYSPERIETLKSKITFGKIGYIGVKKEEVPEGFDMHLDKPFLPSDFVAMIEESMQTVTLPGPSDQPETEEKVQEEKVLSEEINLEDETLSLSIAEEEAENAAEEKLQTETAIADETQEGLESLEELESLEGLDEFDLDETSLPEETPPAAAEEENGLSEKEIASTEDALKELDALDEELDDLENIDLALDSSAVMSTGVAEQYLEETPPLEESGDLPELSKESQTSSPDLASASIGAAAAAAAVAGAEMLHADEEKEEESEAEESPVEEKIESSLDTLESSEDIEHESDYIEEEITTEKLANEFETLNEEEVLKALQNEQEENEPKPEEKTEPAESSEKEASLAAAAAASVAALSEEQPKEEILHEEIVTEGEETMVEANDVEKWIRDAVAKAITPEMIKEALDGMEINVTLNFMKKEG